MEDVVREFNDRPRRATYESLNQPSEIFHLSRRRLQSIRAASIASLLLILLQTVAGVISGSLAITADAGRLFADFIEQHKYSQLHTPVYRRIELMTIFGSALVLTLINVTFTIIGVHHINEGYMDILNPWMLVGAILSLTTNCILLFMHYKADWSGNPSDRQRLTNLWLYRRPELLHGVVNHGFGVLVLLVAVLVMNGYYVADAIATFIIILFSMANIVSAVAKVNREYKTFHFFQNNYEAIPE
ncbi:unnamed protein product, partial [Mesorhabditis spiculigera]